MALQAADLGRLADVIRTEGHPTPLNQLARELLKSTLTSATAELPYAPGSEYAPGAVLLLEGRRAEVLAVQDAHNPRQGAFKVLTLRLPDGSKRRMAAGIPGAPTATLVEIPTAEIERTDPRDDAARRQALREALSADAQFVACNTPYGELWCLVEMLPQISADERRMALGLLPDTLVNGIPISQTTEALMEAIWGITDDGSSDYTLLAFALCVAWQAEPGIFFDSQGWMSRAAWQAFTERTALTSPRMASQVTLPVGVIPAPEAGAPDEADDEDAALEPAEATDALEVDDLESWREHRLQQAVLTLHARHYYEGWLPLRGRVRRLLPPSDGPQQIVIAHHFGGERETFPCWADWPRARIWLSPEMYDTFRQHRIYPGARLRLTAISEREYELSTRPPTTPTPIQVWRMWLDDVGHIQYEEDQEPRRYDIEDQVYIADVRYEDTAALWQQAAEIGNSIFGLMYAEAVRRWEAGRCRDLIVAVDDLYPAIHASSEGRMTTRATIAVELWQRLAFKPLGDGRYLFQPQFEARRRDKRMASLIPPPVVPESGAGAADSPDRTAGLPPEAHEALSRADIPAQSAPTKPQQETPEAATAPATPDEFEQLRRLIESDLVGQSIESLVERKPNHIDSANADGLIVTTEHGTALVRWDWIRNLHTALCNRRTITAEDVEDIPGGRRAAFIFSLLAQFTHIEAHLKPRKHLIYHAPQGPVALRPQQAAAPVEAAPEIPTPAVVNAPATAESPPAAPPPPPSSPKSTPLPLKREDMQTKTLFSQHYLDTRLPEHPEWAEDPLPVFEALRALWAKARQFGDGWSEAQTEDEFIKPVLTALGWAFTVQPKAKQGGRVTRPDYALFADAATQQAAYPFQGDDAAFYGRALAIAEAKFWGRALSQKDTSGRESWKTGENPSHQMVSYLVGTRAPWGILTNGQIWRLYSREVSSTASEFYEMDLGQVFEAGSREQEVGSKGQAEADSPLTVHPSPVSALFKRFWLFFRRAAFTPDARGKSFVQRIHEGSATYAREISDKLKELVYAEVMPEIAGGFVAYRHHQLGGQLETEESLREIYQASLGLLYKLLFLLYAEARGLLPVHTPGYREQSLTALAQWAAARIDAGQPLSTATHATPRYDALRALFHRIDQGDPSLGIPRYNGGLFNPQNPDNAFLEAHRLSDRAVARAVDILVRDAGEPVDYAYISVRNLGAIYEGLLENKLRVIDAAAGQVELVNDKGERKATGSYYTPDYIVAYIVEHTLGPILEARAETFAAAMARVAEARRQLARTADPGKVRLLRPQLEAAERDAREAFLGIKALDPAMGSGHFLVNAVDFLTDGIIQRMQTFHDDHPAIPWDWNPIQQLVERVRREILAEMAAQGIALDPARLDDTALLTRLVMKRCIYGVDLNHMAVELAKLSLWLHSFTVGAPLSFLDHHLRWGNSLIGTDVRTVEAGIQQTETGQFGLFAGPFSGLLDLTTLMVEVVERADATLSDVQQSAGDFEAFQQALLPYKQALDLWVSRHFGNAEADDFLRHYGDDVLPALRGEKQVSERHQAVIERARALWAEKRFFHWDLEFPEVFVDLQKRDWAENPGFDAVIGNPPYLFIISVPEDQRAYYFSEFSTCNYRFDVYALFVEHGLRVLRSGGGLGFIIPHSILNNNSFEKIRAKIIGEASYIQIIDFSERVFADAANEPMLLLVRVKQHPERTESPVLEGCSISPSHLSQASSYLQRHSSSLVESLPGNPFVIQGSEWIQRLLDSTKVVSLGSLCNITQGLRTGDNAKFLVKVASGPLYRKILAGSDIYRYGYDWPGIYVLYDRESLDAPRADFFWQVRDRILVQEVRNVHLPLRIVAYLDTEGFIGLNTTNAIVLKPETDATLGYIMALISSCLINEFFRACFVDNHIATQYLAAIPIPHITFTTPAEERARLLAAGQTLAAAWVQQPNAAATSYGDFLAAPFGAWLAARLGVGSREQEVENTAPPASAIQNPKSEIQNPDVVHDLLAALAGEMLALNREKQAELRGFLAWLERQIGAKIEDLSGKSTLQNYLGDYQKGQVHLVLDDVLTILRKNRRKLQVDPDSRAFQQRLVQEYDASLEKLLPLKRRLAATDRLIDLLVYRLYGLTEEEVAIVEGERVGGTA